MSGLQTKLELTTNSKIPKKHCYTEYRERIEGEHMAEPKRTNEIVLNPGAYVSIQDGTKGSIKTFVGPILVNQGGNELPIVYDNKEFTKVDDLKKAIRKSVVAPEGHYVILTNPAAKDE